MFHLKFPLKVVSTLFAQQIVAHAHHERGIKHVTDRPLVRGRNLDRRVHFAGGGAANEQRRLAAAPLHFFCVKNHFIERRRDEAAHANDVCLVFLCGF